ncbi:hypothetical protein G4Y79_14915 [Phototrophicus methaneseepsis]|uniref:Uncharacterized protein n=1 Tax=Phototrophicus methaneseepsis TaxID=2710758 RepID=A0A7S8E5Y2_9CHLR|nr:hypothetical protein [Phototrophicus methaneseepsis]QPC80994.1 hypothetical protein G4Y79_14915 [Phototrophicus methaneseepsis]
MADQYIHVEDLRQKRDAKAKPHLEQYAPVWLIHEIVFAEEEAIQFNVVFEHPTAGQFNTPAWISRRYRYDAFNDVLYHKGQNRISDEEMAEITQEEPYISTIVADVPNSYGG